MVVVRGAKDMVVSRDIVKSRFGRCVVSNQCLVCSMSRSRKHMLSTRVGWRPGVELRDVVKELLICLHSRLLAKQPEAADTTHR
jgi:hypothetical protein